MKNQRYFLNPQRLSHQQSAAILGGARQTGGKTEPTNGGSTTNPEGDAKPKRPMPEPEPDI